MPYDRKFRLEEVHGILCDSERRPRPYATDGPTGHAISIHTSQRDDVFSRPGNAKRPKRDSIFLSRKDLVLTVHEALNSVPGQIELAKLRHPDVKSVVIRSVIIRERGKAVDVLTIFSPKGGQCSFEWLSTLGGDAHLVQLFVKVYKLDPPGDKCGIHIDTAFVEDYARVEDGEIRRP